MTDSGTTFVTWLASLALVVDVANGSPESTALRGTVVAAVAARELGLGDEDAAAAVYGTLFRYLGCTGYAHEDAVLLGDEHAAAIALSPLEPTDYAAITRAVNALDPDAPFVDRLTRLARVAVHGNAFRRGYEASHCEAAVLLASRLDVTPLVRQTLGALHERWDGDGGPARLGGEQIPLSARVLHVVREATVHFLLRGGRAGVLACLERRAGGQLDPDLCRRLAANEAFLDAFDDEALWGRALETLGSHRDGAFAALPSIDAIVEVFGDFADQKSPWFLGHARRVAELVEGAAHAMALDPARRTLLVRAAWLHDIGRVSVANRVWAKPGPFDPIDWEKVRLHAYVGERVCLKLDPALAELVGQHHERGDGSGYARGTEPGVLGHVLAAADVYTALRSDRPHRPAVSPADAARALEDEVAQGRLRADAVSAVLASAGLRRATPVPRSTMLSEREREVLALVARGLSNKEVARELGISARTVQAHTIHVYDKLGVRTRAGAALRGAELGLLGERPS